MKTIIFYLFALFLVSWSVFAAPITPESYELMKRGHGGHGGGHGGHMQGHGHPHEGGHHHSHHMEAPVESQGDAQQQTSKRSTIEFMNHFERRNFWSKLKDFGKKALSWII